ncbi:MAG: hypothetical protein WA159_18015 [Variovorax sp.]
MTLLMILLFGLSTVCAMVGAWVHYSRDGDATRDRPAALLLLGALVGLSISMGSLDWTLPSHEVAIGYLTPLLTR